MSAYPYVSPFPLWKPIPIPAPAFPFSGCQVLASLDIPTLPPSPPHCHHPHPRPCIATIPIAPPPSPSPSPPRHSHFSFSGSLCSHESPFLPGPVHPRIATHPHRTATIPIPVAPPPSPSPSLSPSLRCHSTHVGIPSRYGVPASPPSQQYHPIPASPPSLLHHHSPRPRTITCTSNTHVDMNASAPGSATTLPHPMSIPFPASHPSSLPICSVLSPGTGHSSPVRRQLCSLSSERRASTLLRCCGLHDELNYNSRGLYCNLVCNPLGACPLLTRPPTAQPILALRVCRPIMAKLPLDPHLARRWSTS
ncbi:hypothetical protein BU15DRAFT_79088 [Melanogaster broomeanus]|nr:hypothetical protein BU15DRAFT_79088 [Melanogaster broomeanus]